MVRGWNPAELPPPPRLMRWRPKLEEYEYDIEYTKGKDDTAADALPRIYVLTRRSENLNIELDKKYNDWEKSTDALPKILKVIPNRKSFYLLSKTELGNYDRVKWLTKLNEIIHTNEKISIGDDSFTETEKNAIKRILLFLNDIVKELNFAWEPIQTYSDEEVDELLRENHDLVGHPGIQKTYERIRKWHRIPDLMIRTQQQVESCDTCQTFKTTRIKPREEPCIIDTSLEPNDKIAINLLGPLKRQRKAISTF